MSIKRYIWIAALALPLAGCATYQGGTPDEYTTSSGFGQAEAYPAPAGSPTFRPGMNKSDPRDAHFTTQPQPVSPAPTVQ